MIVGNDCNTLVFYLLSSFRRCRKETRFDNHEKIVKVAAPIMGLSSTFIRNGIKNKKNIRPMLPQNVWEYLDEMNFYK